MDCSIACTVFFEDPFWVGVLESTSDGGLSAAKITFGAEPKDAEVWEFILTRYYSLAFSKPVTAQQRTVARPNPKRMQRVAAKALGQTGVGTKAQQALQAQYEANKQEHKARSREERDAEAERQFQLRQEKKKAKHKGH
ncbi:MAG: YjdF family protein [Eubacteriales bacterium]|nr:YjdF family protein [Eubacteriales bacterium]